MSTLDSGYGTNQKNEGFSSHSGGIACTPAAQDSAVHYSELELRMLRVHDWAKDYAGNQHAKNFVAIRAILNKKDFSDQQKFSALIAQIEFSKANAPWRGACLFGRHRTPVTQAGYDQLGFILQGAFSVVNCLESVELSESVSSL